MKVILLFLIILKSINSFEFDSKNEDLKEAVFQSLSHTRTDNLCTLQLIYIKDHFDTNRTIFPMLDSWGKLPSGMSYGHLFAVGNYDQCVEVDAELPTIFGHLKGKYCKAVSKGPILVGSGICIPKSCDPEYIEYLISKALQTDKFKVQECSTDEMPKFKAEDIVIIIILITLLFLMILGTSYDYLSVGESRNRFLLAFSVTSNASKLFHISSSKTENISCINGIRVLSIIWVIFGHTYFYALRVPLINTFSIVPWIHSFFSLFIQNGVLAVDTFFFLSGCLVSFIGFKKLEASRKLNVPMMYIHRYLRITPLVAFAMLFLVSILKFFGRGPFWDGFVDGMTSTCEKYWWRNLLYIQNYFEITEMCLGHSWYLAVDFQLFLISPIFLYGLLKFGKKFVYAMILLILLCCGCIYGTFYSKGFTGAMITFDKKIGTRQNTTYLYTHTRCPIWLVGFIFGYFLHKTRYSSKKLPWIARFFGWVAAISILFAMVIGPYQSTQIGYVQSTFEGATYESFGKIGWGLMLSWIIYNCFHDKGGFINSFLSHPFWQPFARLSYAMYISHMAVMTINMGNSHVENHFSNFEIILKFWAIFGITVITSIVLVLTFESPVIGLEKIIFKNKNIDKVQDQTSSNV